MACECHGNKAKQTNSHGQNLPDRSERNSLGLKIVVKTASKITARNSLPRDIHSNKSSLKSVTQFVFFPHLDYYQNRANIYSSVIINKSVAVCTRFDFEHTHQ